MKKFFILGDHKSGFSGDSMLEVIRQEIRILREKIMKADEFSYLFDNIEIVEFLEKKKSEDIYFYKYLVGEKIEVRFSNYEYVEIIILYKNGKENPDRYKIIFSTNPYQRKNYFSFDLFYSSFTNDIHSIDGYNGYVSFLDEKTLKQNHVPEKVWKFLEHILLNSSERIEHLEFHK